MFKIRYFFFVILMVGGLAGLGAIEISETRLLFSGDTLEPECLKSGDVVELRVTVKGARDSAYVGATIIDPEGDQINIDVVPVITRVDSAGKATYSVAVLAAEITDEMNSADSTSRNQNLRIVYRLWDTRVEADSCEKLGIDGKPPGDWCREYGYHMEDPVGLALTRSLPAFCPPPDPVENPED